jgi:hypothetical protein
MVSGACPGELKEGRNETKPKFKAGCPKFSTEQALLCYYPKENPRAVAGRSDTGENEEAARTLSGTLEGGSKMRGTKNINSTTGGCLLSGDNSLSGSEPPSFEAGEPAWKVGTLPTELLPQNHIHFSRQSALGQRGAASSRKLTDLSTLTEGYRIKRLRQCGSPGVGGRFLGQARYQLSHNLCHRSYIRKCAWDAAPQKLTIRR